MWTTIYFIPFLKYSANLPTVGDPNTIVFRASMYVIFIVLSGLGAFGFSRIYKKIQSKKFVAFLGYTAFISIVFVIMPPTQIRLRRQWIW
jgi:predicted membrane-bound mannosyltransferase